MRKPRPGRRQWVSTRPMLSFSISSQQHPISHRLPHLEPLELSPHSSEGPVKMQLLTRGGLAGPDPGCRMSKLSGPVDAAGLRTDCTWGRNSGLSGQEKPHVARRLAKTGPSPLGSLFPPGWDTENPEVGPGLDAPLPQHIPSLPGPALPPRQVLRFWKLFLPALSPQTHRERGARALPTLVHHVLGPWGRASKHLAGGVRGGRARVSPPQPWSEEGGSLLPRDAAAPEAG